MEEDYAHLMDEISDLFRSNDLLDDDILICECFCVSVADIRESFAASRSVDLDILAAKYGLGDGCKSCLKNNDWLNKIF